MRGKTVTIQIVDKATGGWGHVNVDQIVQSDTKPKVPDLQNREREFTVENKYLIMPIQNKGRRGRGGRIQLFIAGEEVRRYGLNLATGGDTADWYAFTKSFRGFIETLTFPNCRPVLYDTCVYWYRETGARNPYPAVPLAGRVYQRPGRREQWVTPPTFQTPKPEPPKPGTIEGEQMKVLRVDSGRAWVQNMGNYRDAKWSGGHQLIWTHGKQDNGVELAFNVIAGGKQEVLIVLSKAADYGIAQLAIDGKNVGGPIDCYDERVTKTDEISLGILDLEAGQHVLRATVIGANEKARDGVGAGSHILGVDYLRLKK